MKIRKNWNCVGKQEKELRMGLSSKDKMILFTFIILFLYWLNFRYLALQFLPSPLTWLIFSWLLHFIFYLFIYAFPFYACLASELVPSLRCISTYISFKLLSRGHVFMCVFIYKKKILWTPTRCKPSLLFL